MSKTPFRIGTRGSALALWQANWVKARLQQHWPERTFELVIVKTHGDLDRRTPLSRSKQTGIFVKALEEALLAGEIDAAVHSMKDVPSEIPAGLEIVSICEREDPRDALITKGDLRFGDLPRGTTLATGSPRRRAQLAHARPDLTFAEIRGNLDTRLRKLQKSQWAGLVVAVAGLRRLGREEVIAEALPLELCLPAVGQGAIGIEIRKDDAEAREICAVEDHHDSHVAVVAERAFLRAVGGGCQVPIAAHATVNGGEL
ncbi:MAG: hydroxymethylbilane synthase, partial [Calditrichaeota bacterium]|nr:hydroxymethylbilane synthase [Calditrichota bacterium]